jgi:hypothetical protein
VGTPNAELSGYATCRSHDHLEKIRAPRIRVTDVYGMGVELGIHPGELRLEAKLNSAL